MNFNIYINDQLYQELEHYRQLLSKSRNSVITEALTEWINNHKQTTWPQDFFKFNQDEIGLYPDTKELRDGIIEPQEHKF